ncbi:MAG: hypothetical protein M1836_001511 [Candelina mexicana]|nr:MAG: hypothetical protein M1836_001511 [Candelina mexicana]
MATLTINLVISLQDGSVVSAATVPGDRKLGVDEKGATVTIASVTTSTNELDEGKTENSIGKPDATALKDLAAPVEAPVAKKVGSKDKDVAWYFKNINNIPGPMQELLEKWSGLAPNDVRAHIHRVRDQAWDVWPYPCIGMFFFLDLGLSLLPPYAQVLNRLRTNNEKLLDLGCCFGQDVRKLVFDGAPAENVYGTELLGGYIDEGYALFCDKDKLKSKFIVADIFDAKNDELNALNGKMDILYAGSFFHLWNWEDQVKVACRLVELMPARPGSLVLGRQAGSLKPGEIPHRINKTGTMFQHDPQTFAKMWKEVGEKTGSEWNVVTQFEVRDASAQGKGFNSPDTRILTFAVYRL